MVIWKKLQLWNRCMEDKLNVKFEISCFWPWQRYQYISSKSDNQKQSYTNFKSPAFYTFWKFDWSRTNPIILGSQFLRGLYENLLGFTEWKRSGWLEHNFRRHQLEAWLPNLVFRILNFSKFFQFFWPLSYFQINEPWLILLDNARLYENNRFSNFWKPTAFGSLKMNIFVREITNIPFHLISVTP